MPFGTFLHQQRLAHHLTREALAGSLGCSLPELGSLEMNRRPPSYRELQCLAGVLQVPTVVLLAEAGYLRRSVALSSQ